MRPEGFFHLRRFDGAVPRRIDVEEVADRRRDAAADRPARPEEDPSGRDVLGKLDRSRRPGETHRPALEEVDPHPAGGVHRGGEFRVERLTVGLLQARQHLADQPDERGLGEEIVEGQNKRLRRGLEAARPGVRRIAVLHQGDQEVKVRIIATLQHFLKRPGRELVLLQIDQVHLPLGILGDPGAGFGAELGVADGDHPGIVVSDPVHRPRPEAEDETDHPLRGIDPVGPGIEVPGEGHPGQAGEEVLLVGHPGDPLNEDRHLLVALAQPPGAAVGQGVGIQGARVDELHRAQKGLQPLLRRSLVCAVFAVVLPGKGVPEAVLEQAARTGDDRRLAEVGEHVPELLHDLRRKPSGEKALLHLRKFLVRNARGAGELKAESEEVVVHQEGKKDVRPDVEGVVGLEDLRKVDLSRFRDEDPPGEEHPRRLPADPSRTDEAVPDGEEIVERDVVIDETAELRMGPDHHPGELLLEGGDLRRLLVEIHPRLVVLHQTPVDALPGGDRFRPGLERFSARRRRKGRGIPAPEDRRPDRIRHHVGEEHLGGVAVPDLERVEIHAPPSTW